MADPITIAAGVAAAASVGGTAIETLGGLAGAAKEKADARSRERMAKIQADQSETVALADLKRQIGNIRAIRASAGASVDAPTIQAIIAEERETSDANRRKKKLGYELDAQQARVDRRLIQQKSLFTIAGGAFKGISTIAGAIPSSSQG